LQEELESMQPLLAQAAQDTEDTMEQIKKDSVSFLFLFLARHFETVAVYCV
jgi:hypothetical protein